MIERDKILLPEEPEAFRVINSKSGVASKYIITCEHAGHIIPKKLNNLGLDETMLKSDVVSDFGAAFVAEFLSDMLGCIAVLSNYSRLVIDCNRDINVKDSIPEISQRGFPVPGNIGLSDLDKKLRQDVFFWPYQNEVENRSTEYVFNNKKPPYIVSIHSFAEEYDGKKRPWHIGVVWRRDNQLAKQVIKKLSNDKSIYVGDNQPYTADDSVGYGYTLNTYAEAKNYPHILIEIRQDLIKDKNDAKKWAQKLYKVFKDI